MVAVSLNSQLINTFNNKLLSIFIPNFATPKECQALVKAFHEIGFDNYHDVHPPIGRIGVTQFEAKKKGKSWYFEKTAQEKIKQSFAFDHSFNPLARLLTLLKNNFHDHEISIAKCNDHGNYYAGLVRQINDSALIHADYAPYDADGWEISNVVTQLAFNFCLIAPQAGGECIVYDKMWNLDRDEKFKYPNSYGYDPKIVNNCEYTSIKSVMGSAYFFNSRNFHEVLSCEGDRITVSCFIGLTSENKILIWS